MVRACLLAWPQYPMSKMVTIVGDAYVCAEIKIIKTELFRYTLTQNIELCLIASDKSYPF